MHKVRLKFDLIVKEFDNMSNSLVMDMKNTLIKRGVDLWTDTRWQCDGQMYWVLIII